MKTLAALILIAAPAWAADDKETLQQALSKVAALDSYSFKGETEFNSPFGAGAPGGQVPTLDGKYQKDTGLYIKSDKGDVFRKGDRVLVKQGAAGEWTDLANFQPPTPPAGDPAKPRARGGAMMGKLMLRNLKAPHEELKDLAKGFKSVKKDEKTEKIGDVDCFQYSGDLSEEAMRSSPLGRILTQFGGANASVNGTARVWVDTQGNVVIYETVTKATVEFQGNQIDFSLTRRSEITDANKTKVEVPEAVQKLLADKVKSEDKKDQ
jgi:hypothetical protein